MASEWPRGTPLEGGTCTTKSHSDWSPDATPTLGGVVLVEVGVLAVAATTVQASQVDHVWGAVCQPHQLPQPTQELLVAAGARRVSQDTEF